MEVWLSPSVVPRTCASCGAPTIVRWGPGVAGGLARRWRADPYVVRLAFVVLSPAGGFGVLLYPVAWSPADPPDTRAGARPTRAWPVVQRSISVGLVTLALVWLMRAPASRPGDGIVVPVVIVAAGSALLWFTARLGAVDPIDRLVNGKVPPARAIAGGVLRGRRTALAASRGSLHALRAQPPRSAWRRSGC